MKKVLKTRVIFIILLIIIGLVIAITYLFLKNSDQKEILINIDNVEIGDYIKMTPSRDNYIVKTSKSGYSIDQHITPSELDLWQVISKNTDGTTEVVSTYVSSTKIYFRGKIGYLNFIANLNEIATSYINEKYAITARHIGYSNQTEEINSNIDYPVWKEETSDNSNELVGGGDTLYKNDYKLIEDTIKTTKAKNIKKEKASYWLASRYYKYNNGDYSFNGRIIDEEGNILESELITSYNPVGVINQLSGHRVRPILTLRKDIQIKSGDGKSEDSAYQLK